VVSLTVLNLSELQRGERARVVGVACGGHERRRLTELGVRAGAVVQVVRRAPLGGALAVRVGGGLLALRPRNAASVMVELEAGDG
jgi:Fe2+ transport system protein FeoA